MIGYKIENGKKIYFYDWCLDKFIISLELVMLLTIAIVIIINGG
jgi:hypothetical protein